MEVDGSDDFSFQADDFWVPFAVNFQGCTRWVPTGCKWSEITPLSRV